MDKLIYSCDSKGKFLFIRHGQTICNADTDLIARKTNVNYVDSRLSKKGESQTEELNKIINKMDIKKVYASPLYRALQTATNILQGHPNLSNITVEVIPILIESPNCIDDLLLDIKQTKKDFNMNSNVKINWSTFDKYVEHLEYDENFYYFENLNNLDSTEKKDIYLKLKALYDKSEMESFRKEISNIPRFRLERKKDNESLKHVYDRGLKFKEFLKNTYKDTLNDTNEKVIIISHGNYMQTITNPNPIESDQINKLSPESYLPKNCEIVSIYI